MMAQLSDEIIEDFRSTYEISLAFGGQSTAVKSAADRHTTSSN
jgi:hypothetical protein